MFQGRICLIKNRKVRAILSLFCVAGRAEYFVADMLPLLIGVLLGLTILDKQGLAHFVHNNLWILLHGLIITICAHYAAVWCNDLGDYELDKGKSELPHSVDLIGKSLLWSCVLLSTIIGTVLIIHLSLVVGTYVYLSLWVLGIGITFAYSCRPLRLKKYLLLNELTRGAPLIILLPFGYFLVTLDVSTALLLYTLGLAVNLFGLFMVGEVWCYRDDFGQVNTVGTIYGYCSSLRLSVPAMPFGITLMMFGFWELAHTMNHFVYLAIWVISLIVIMTLFLAKIYRRRYEYDTVAGKCGLFTKVGTTSFWLFSALSIMVLLLW